MEAVSFVWKSIGSKYYVGIFQSNHFGEGPINRTVFSSSVSKKGLLIKYLSVEKLLLEADTKIIPMLDIVLLSKESIKLLFCRLMMEDSVFFLSFSFML